MKQKAMAMRWPWHGNVAAPGPTTSQRQSTDATPTLPRHDHDEDRRYAPATFHAAALLTWLQGPGGRTGWITYAELQAAYREMAVEEKLEPHPWPAVGGQLRRLIAQPKRYVTRRRIRMWWIPPARPELVAASGEFAKRRA